ncbi:MAG: hypothetical protein ACLQVF_28215 [Isosphaeraceae bacterium]
MRTALFCVTALCTLAIPCQAQQTASPPETLIRLSVQPAPAPRRALRYLLLPELNEMNPGNPIQNYFKCFMEQQKFFFDKESVERREKLLVMPLAELPATELRTYGGFALRQADWAARLDTPDWQILLKVKTDGVSMLIPEVQQIRPLASALKVRFRAEVALGRFDDAIRTAKTMFAMARHLGEHPTLVGNLVGCTIANMAIGVLEEMLQQPGCPNLYWALTNLPSPLVRLEKGIEGERALVLAEFRELDPTAPMSADQLKRFIAYIDTLLGAGKPLEPKKGVQAWLDARTKDEAKVSAARRRLVESGLVEDRLVRFPAEQVILLDEKREYEVRRDDIMKMMSLPAWQGEALAAQAKVAREPALFEVALLEGVSGVRLPQARLDQRIALLRHVEALRLYAVEHQGTLPAKLTDTPVPLPADSFTGKPFRYEVSGTTAHLRGSPPPSEETEPAIAAAANSWTNGIHYEVTFQK